MSVQYWTLFYYGGSEVTCSKHRTFEAALRAAVTCERKGGADHRIVEVREVSKAGRRATADRIPARAPRSGEAP